MSYDIDIKPCGNGTYGWGKDIGSVSGKFWSVFRWNGQAWQAIASFTQEATARSEAMRRAEPAHE